MDYETMKEKPYDTLWIDKAADESSAPSLPSAQEVAKQEINRCFEMSARRSLEGDADGAMILAIAGRLMEQHYLLLEMNHMRQRLDADNKIIEGLRAEIAGLVHQRDEARQECKQAVMAERKRVCEIIQNHYWDSLTLDGIGEAHGNALVKMIMDSGNG
jgi:hypothetical protein